MQVFLVLAAILAPALSARIPHIVGGSDVEVPGTYPWQASLQQFNSHICGMAVISDKWLATAAHCVGSSPAVLSVVVGMHDTTLKQGNPVRFSIKQIIAHPDWEMNGNKGFPNDMAVVEISGMIDLSDNYVQTIAMAQTGQSFLGSECVITGWGKIGGGFFDPPATILQEAPVEVYTKQYCQSVWNSIPISDYHICVGDKGTASACSGDSGGPLACSTGPNSWVLAGVTSWGRSNCSTQYPSVYASIAYFREWIRAQTGV